MNIEAPAHIIDEHGDVAEQVGVDLWTWRMLSGTYFGPETDKGQTFRFSMFKDRDLATHGHLTTDTDEFGDAFDAGWESAVDMVLEALYEGEVPTFTVASWVTRSVSDTEHADEERLKSIRSVRVDDLIKMLEENR